MQVIVHGRLRAYEPQGVYQLYVDDPDAGRRRRPAPALRAAARQAGGRGPVRGRAQAAVAALAAADRGGDVAGGRGVARHRQRHAPPLSDGRAGAGAHQRAGGGRGPGHRPRAEAHLRASRGSTWSSWRVAAARWRTCGRSTTKAVVRAIAAAPDADHRGGRSRVGRDAGRFRGRCPSANPSAAAEQAAPDMSQFPTILARLRDRASAAMLASVAGRRRFLAEEDRALTRLAPDVAAARQRAAELVDRGHRALTRPGRWRTGVPDRSGRCAARALAGRHPGARLCGGAAGRRHRGARPRPGQPSGDA